MGNSKNSVILILLDHPAHHLLYMSHLCLFSGSDPYQEYIKVARKFEVDNHHF